MCNAFISNCSTLIGGGMIPVQIRVTKKLIDMIDQLVDEGMYSNRSEAIRDAIRRHVNNGNGEQPVRQP